MKMIRKIFRYLVSSNRWSLIYRARYSSDYIDIEQSNDLARADCFLVEKDNNTFVFFEEFIIENNRKGYLCVGELNESKRAIVNVKKILEKKIHMSYPHVFKYDGEWYMIPETHLSSSIDLYRFKNFPEGLEKVKTLISDIDAVDTTIVVHNGTVFLFANIKKNGISHNKDLSIFYADDLLNDKLMPHPQNPIKTDLRYSRMAGAFLLENNNLYRFAQDCSINYGSKMYKFSVNGLSKTSYSETLVDIIDSPRGCIAAHTYSKSLKYEMIDVVYADYSVKNILKNSVNLMSSVLRKLYK